MVTSLFVVVGLLWRCWFIVFAFEPPLLVYFWFLVVVGPLVVVCALVCLLSVGRLLCLFLRLCL